VKHNAFTVNHPTLYRVWGNDFNPPSITPPDGTPVFVLWSPSMRQHIMSITTDDYRYDALVTEIYFRRDRTLDPAEAIPEPAETYYLHRQQFPA